MLGRDLMDTCDYIDYIFAWQISVGILLFSEWRAEGTVQSYTVYIYINIDIKIYEHDYNMVITSFSYDTFLLGLALSH